MMTFGDTHEYATWDAAYVLGSLSSDDRREYEAHLATCESCREAVSQLCGVPALLGRLDADEVAAMDAGNAPAQGAPPLRPEMLSSLLAKVSWRRRRARVMTWTVAAAAAAVLVIGVFVAMQATAPMLHAPAGQAQAEAAPLTMMQVKPSELSSTVTLTSHGWGTRIDMNCTYAAAGPKRDTDDEAGDRLAMVVVGRDGTLTQLATWVALDGVSATPGGSTSMPVSQIASVQIVSVDSGAVLLQRSL
jgi:hypothetical protein